MKVAKDGKEQEMENEISMYTLLGAHPSICLFIGSYGRAAIALERFETDLFELVDARGPLAAAHALDVARQLASALAHMHARGVVHCDLKTENVLCRDGDRTVALADLGLATRSGTRTERFLGSSAYAAPECFSSQLVAPPRDVWSLGVVLFGVSSGVMPFPLGDGGFPAAARAARTADPRLDLLGSMDVQNLVSRTLERDPAQRPTAWEVYRELTEN